MKRFRKTGSIALAVAALGAGGLLAGCGNDDTDTVDEATAPLEDAADGVEGAAEDAGDAIDDAAEDAGDAIDDAADDVEDAADDVEDDIGGDNTNGNGLGE